MLNEFLKKEAPIQGLTGLGGGVPSRLLTLASGEVTYVDDVFSTFLYDGTGSAQTITNGIDLDGEGGLVWAKSRTGTRNHILSDTEHGTGKVLFSNLTVGTDTDATTITSYNSNGFTMGSSTLKMNTSGEEFCSWTFRKCPGFFDIVTFTSTGSTGVDISHNLGSTPGCIFLKALNATDDWLVYHRSTGTGKALFLNSDSAVSTQANYWVSVTSTSFRSDFANSASGVNWIAYIFAHNDGSFGESSDEAVIKCGSYTGNGTSSNSVTLGFEPQWLLVKDSSSTNNWGLYDTMRGITTGGNDPYLMPDLGNDEDGDYNLYSVTPTGFEVVSSNGFVNGNSQTYIYIAIRRPHKPPEAGTEVFKPELLTSASQTFNPGFAPDMNWHMFDRSSSSGFAITGTRLTGNGSYLQTYSTGAEGSFASWKFDAPTGKFTQDISSGSTGGGIEYFFKRAPGFFDVVAYDGNGSSTHAIPHNLGVIPELIAVKRRDDNGSWFVKPRVNSATRVQFNQDLAESSTVIDYWSTTTQTSSNFYVGDAHGVNQNNGQYIAYLFATLDGISKVGTYTGTGSNIDVDCGFTAGARFVLIKRIDSTGDWFIYDSARGIVSGNDPYLKLNGGQEVTGTDYIDPLNSGFTVTSSAPAALNASGGTYLFLAIA